MRTQVAIIGAGPAGLMLAHLLALENIDVVVVERQSAEHVLSRIRAGVLEEVTTALIRRIGIDGRMRREEIPHSGLTILNGADIIPIEVQALTGKKVTVYGQTEIQRDLIDAAGMRGLHVIWNASDVTLHDIESITPTVTYRSEVGLQRLACDFVVGCDGFHGVTRASIPAEARRHFERVYPFGWLGVLADVAPCHHEVVYVRHADGFALASMRSPTRSRYYIQVPVDEDIEQWSDDRFWAVLTHRLGPDIGGKVGTGPSIEKSIAPLRSFVSEPMRYGQVFLAGDAAHIVPPTGAKGLNLAASDVSYLGDALIRWYKHSNADGINGYSSRALARVWKTERFSWYLTRLLHRFPDEPAFDQRMQEAELDYIAQSVAARTTIAENYVGLPL